jgi:hypothetical protein
MVVVMGVVVEVKLVGKLSGGLWKVNVRVMGLVKMMRNSNSEMGIL